MNEQRKVVLISGAGSGIGRAMAETLTKAGFIVYGTSRSARTEAWPMLTLDVCDDDSVWAAVDELLRREGRIDVLINNAGYGDAGAVEDVTLAEAKRQFETNVFGVLRLCRAVLPTMRKQHSGRIVNVGSVAGFIAVPFFGMYGASKAALASLTESLRMEVRPFGIDVALLEPGDIKTEGAGNIFLTPGSHGSPYQAALEKAVGIMAASERDGIAMDVVAAEVLALLTARRPPLRRVVDWRYRLIRLAKRLLPDAVLEWIVVKMHS